MATVHPTTEPLPLTTLPEGVAAPRAGFTAGAPGLSSGPDPAYEGFRLYQFTVEQYHRLAASEILDPDERVFLIDGLLVHKMTKNAPHVIAMDNLTPMLVRLMPEGWHLSNQNPVVVSTRGEPEPDFQVVRGRPRDYRHRRVSAQDVAIVIEVSESSLRADRTVMKARYAAAGIAEYWIVNLIDNRVEAYTDPTGPDASPDYRRREDHGLADSVPFRLEGRDLGRLSVAEILTLD